MAASRGFQPRTIAGLPNSSIEQTPLTKQLDQLTQHLILESKNNPTETIDSDIDFEVCPNPSSTNDAAIVNAFDFIQQQRNEVFYKTIHQKIINGDNPTPDELLYFSLTTDNLRHLTQDMVLAIRQATEKYKQLFSTHIILLHYTHPLTAETKKEKRDELWTNAKGMLKNRNQTNNHLIFCNLAGIQLMSVNFSGLYLQWLNLENANFSNSIFDDCTFKNCLLTHANFKSISTDTPLVTQGLTFLNCRLNQSDFSESMLSMQATACDFQRTHFSTANIKAHFNGCNLQGSTFVRTTFDASTRFDNLCSLNNCDLSTAQLPTLTPEITHTGLCLFTQHELMNPTTKLTEKLNTLTPHCQFSTEQLSNYRVMIASSLLNQLNTLPETTKNAAICAARAHPIFASQNTAKQVANAVSTFCGLFSSNQISKTKAQMMLEAALATTPSPTIAHP